VGGHFGKLSLQNARLDVNLPAEFQIQGSELTSLAKDLTLCESYNRN